MNSKQKYLVPALMLALVAGCSANKTDKAAVTTSPVVMVCEHGAVKSLIATVLFDKEAKKRGLPFRAVSRGLTPYEKVPDKIAKALESDGFNISSFKPQKLSSQEFDNSSHVIAIGVDLSAFQGAAASSILQWDDIPPCPVRSRRPQQQCHRHPYDGADEPN